MLEYCIALSRVVNVQGCLVGYSWSRLFYFIRGCSEGSGYFKGNFEELIDLFGVSRRTFYYWLEAGAKVGAFRFYAVKDGMLTVVLGSKFAVCKNLGLDDWGGTIELPIRQCLRKDFYIFASLIQTADQQRKSWWAAKYEAKKSEKDGQEKKRRLLDIPLFFQGATSETTSLDQSGGAISIHKIRHIVNDRFVLTRKSFVPIGATQESIGASIGVCSRTVRNHQLGVKRLQLCYPIGRSEFLIREQLAAEAWESSGCFESSNQYWKYGPNIYDLDFKLKSERFQRLTYEFFLLRKNSARGFYRDKEKLLVKSDSTSKLSFLNFLRNKWRERVNRRRA